MREVPVIGLTGYARSGKDTIGRILVEEFGYFRVGLADGVREAALALNPTVMVPHITSEQPDSLQPMTLRLLVEILGWEKAKEIPEVRRLLQAMGTEVGRDIFGENVWTDLAKRKMEGHKRVVVTDVRFPNEADMIRELGGEVWKVERAGIKPVNNHPSERLDFRVDWLIVNDTTIEALKGDVRDLLN